MVLISAAVGAAVKWYGSRRDDDEDDVQGDDPVVRALLRAVNRGELDDLQELVHDDCRIYLNAYELTRGDLNRGPELWTDAINDLRSAFPDVRWKLYDELAGKDEGKHKIAVRFVSKTNIEGVVTEFPVAAFGVIEKKKLIEWHQVTDVETYNSFRTRTGEERLG
ncbi:MAG: nuclear transport factor 2 family protein [Acidimicrobiales bacterium]